MSKLPPGWVETTMGEVCEVVAGSTPKTQVQSYWNGDIPWITPDDLSRHNGKYIHGGARSITKAGYDSCSTHLVPAGTVLYTTRAPIGYAAIAAEPVCTNQGFKNFVPSEGVDSGYLYWYLRYATPAIREMGSGTTFKEVSGKVAKTIPVILPPNEEQRRIVEAIEEQLSRLDAAQSALRTASQRTETLRLASLHDILVEDDDSPTRRIADLLEVNIGGVWGEAPSKGEVDVSVFRVTEFRPDGLIDPSTAALRSITWRQLQRRDLRPDDLLLEKSGGGPNQLVGRVAMVPEHTGPAVCGNFVQQMRCDRSAIVPRYLFWVMTLLHETGFVARFQRASTNIRNLKTRDYLQIEIPVPSILVQERAAAHLDMNAEEVQRLRSVLRRASVRSKALEVAILREAFAGCLVAHDSAEGSKRYTPGHNRLEEASR